MKTFGGHFIWPNGGPYMCKSIVYVLCRFRVCLGISHLQALFFSFPPVLRTSWSVLSNFLFASITNSLLVFFTLQRLSLSKIQLDTVEGAGVTRGCWRGRLGMERSCPAWFRALPAGLALLSKLCQSPCLRHFLLVLLQCSGFPKGYSFKDHFIFLPISLEEFNFHEVA